MIGAACEVVPLDDIAPHVLRQAVPGGARDA